MRTLDMRAEIEAKSRGYCAVVSGGSTSHVRQEVDYENNTPKPGLVKG